MNAQQKSNVSFVGDPIEDSPELAAKRADLPDLEKNMFRVQYSGQKNESSYLRVVVYLTIIVYVTGSKYTLRLPAEIVWTA